MRLNYSNTANITDMWECIGNIPVMSVKGMCWQCYCDEWQCESIGNTIVMSVNVLIMLLWWVWMYWICYCDEWQWESIGNVIVMSVNVLVILFRWLGKYWYVILMSVKVLVCYSDECERSNYSMLLWCVKVLVTLPVLWWVYKESACYSDDYSDYVIVKIVNVLVLLLWWMWMYQ